MKSVICSLAILCLLTVPAASACPYTPVCTVPDLPCGTTVTFSGSVESACPLPIWDLDYFRAEGDFRAIYEYDGHVDFPNNTGDLLYRFDTPLEWCLPTVDAIVTDVDWNWWFSKECEATFEDAAPFAVRLACWPHTDLLDLVLYDNHGESHFSWCDGMGVEFISYDVRVVGGLGAHCFEPTGGTLWLGYEKELSFCHPVCFSWAYLDLKTRPCPVPEPAGLMSLCTGLVVLGGYKLRRKQ